MKRWIPFTLVLITAASLFFYYLGQKKSSEEKIVVIEKGQEGLFEHPMTPTEESIHQKLHPKQAKKEEPTRQPSSLQIHPQFADRQVIGDHPDLMERAPINQYNGKWKEKLGHDLLRFQPQGTKLIIENELSLVQVRKEHTRLVEQVVVSYINLDGRHSSYRAFVDSETAEIVQTWDKTIFEDYKAKPLTLTPSGNL